MSEVQSPVPAESRLTRFSNTILSLRGANYIVGALGLCALIAATTVTLNNNEQLIVAGVCVVIFFVVGRGKSRRTQVFLEVLSALVSLRYLTWRLTETLDFNTWIQGILGVTLLMAELYALYMLFLSYFQTIQPLHRSPLPLPDNVDDWPTVDVFIPTYDEQLSIVRLTVLGALGIDWPPDKVNVYILDDGVRPEFEQFAKECGALYIGRVDSAHAKAGNLNHAIKRTSGDYILILDCDHIPTRAFLQIAMGWMVADRKIALMQTPHHFYSPDPFQRNLAVGYRTPPEGNLFYGVIQDGNDFWDATFFCGSCAILRREAIESIGGFAVETVTEDAHTALRMQRRGWSTAYLRIPVASGLATERLTTHIGQRMRWARGMIQIFRVDNPMLGRGLKLGQRLCYLSAMTSFFFAIPRVTFLASPLAFLFAGQNIIAASPTAVAAYAIPHMFHSIATAAKVNKGWRYSFWSEVYETTMALFLVRVTVVTMLFPSKGKFNVTEKGGVLEEEEFDLGATYPNIIFATIMMGGLLVGLFEMTMHYNQLDSIAMHAYMLNCVWALISLIILFAAIAVGRETKQVRYNHRVEAHIPVTVYEAPAEGQPNTYHNATPGMTQDVSMGGVAVHMPWPDVNTGPVKTRIHAVLDGEEIDIPATMLRCTNGKAVFTWDNNDLDTERDIVRFVFGRADAWLQWNNYEDDKPLRSLLSLLHSIKALFRKKGKMMANSRPKTKPLTLPVERREPTTNQSGQTQEGTISRAAS